MDALDASSSLLIPKKYDVFLSFRGKDTRDKFISHLYAALDRKKIKIYKDDVSLERGDEISPALLEAIEKSKISIVVFSKDYASSSWCLSELVHILKCHRENKQMVIPIFYEVDPSHVRKQEGSYEEAFLKHQDRFKDNMEILQNWKFALTESANLSGWDSQVIRPESKLVEAIVEDVLRKLSRGPPSNFDYKGLVGIDKKIEEIKSLLSVSSPKVRIVGIWGMAGVGKTTLAEVIYHQLSSQFEACCFVPNVREEAEKGSLINLRNKLLAKLLKEENLNVGTPTLGPTFVKERLQRTKALIVLDDINHEEQLNSFVGDRDQFSCGSKIVITTRDASLLRDISADGIYEVKQLDVREALQLFNSIAFRGNSPPTDYVVLSENVVKHAGGVPLALKVLGSHFRSLYPRSKEAWEEALDKLKVVPHKDIHKALRISFDALDNMEKDIFLDIACFFKGMRKDFVEKILDACGFFANIGIDALRDKSLITTKNDGKLWMHDLLEEMGQKIICEESTELGERSRLWIAEDVCQVLENNQGTAKIQGILLKLFKFDEEIHLEPAIFKKMHNLRLLIIYDFYESKKCKVYLQNGLCYLPHSIRYLEWRRCPLKSLPPNFKPKNLVELKMPHSQLEQLWDGVQDLSKLRGIDLRHSIHLTQISDLSRAPNLERLILENCTSLCQDRLRSLQNLTKLTHVNLDYCSNLHSVLDKMFEMASLRTLTLRGISNLNTIPMTIGTSLVDLDLSSTAIECLPSSIGSLNNLCNLNLSSTAIECLPSSIGSLKHLCRLNVYGCKRLANLPSSMNELDSLEYLGLSSCSVLEKFPKLPISIVILDVSGTAIKEVGSSSIEGCFRLKFFFMSNCKSLECLPTNIYTLRSLHLLLLDGCSKLKNLPEILEPIDTSRSLHLSCIGLETLGIHECEKLELIPSSISPMDRLRELKLTSCPKLDYYPVPSVLDHLDLSHSTITEIPESIIKVKTVLRAFVITDCKNLRSLPELPLSLTDLNASGCVSFEVVFNSRRALTRESWINHHNTRETYEYSVLFYDCVKLDKKERDNILIDIQLKVLNAAMQLKDQMHVPRVGACYPGNEIPKWFEYQNEGPTIRIKLPGQWNNSNFLGFVVCAVAGDSKPDANKLICEFNLKSSESKIVDFEWTIIYESMSNSSHLCMCFQTESYHDCLDAEEASFYFSFEESESKIRLDSVGSSKSHVKKCGIRILYCQDLEEFGSNFINDQLLGLEKSNMDLDELDSDAIFNKPQSSGASRNNDSDTEEREPKRIKF